MSFSGSQTVGPFFNYALTADASAGVMARSGAQGQRVRLRFQVFDGDGAPTPADCMIELWQADAGGRFAHPLDARAADADPDFCGFGRLEVDANGECIFETVMPGCVSDGQAPHIGVAVFGRGLLKQLHTRLYFAGDARNEKDPVLVLVPESRRETLLARPEGENGWRFEIRLQGEGETVFFDV